jgi:ankyrin repeat protein
MLCLCDRGADYEAQTITGMRSLHYAAMNGHISTVKELIEVRNADIKESDDRGWAALRLARQESKDSTATYLVSRDGVDDILVEEFDEVNDDN